MESKKKRSPHNDSPLTMKGDMSTLLAKGSFFEVIDIEPFETDDLPFSSHCESPLSFSTSSLNDIFGGLSYSSENSQTKPIYLSFYTPATMINVATRGYGDASTKCRVLYNIIVFLWNLLLSLLKFLMTKSNELTIYVTKDVNYPDYNYSHVEISTEEYTYVAKWGSSFKRIDGKMLSPDTYGSVCINLSLSDYDVVVKECEEAAIRELKFNYVGSLCNFIFPFWLRNILFVNGLYEKEDQCFCSEFVSRALIKTKAFGHLFLEEGLSPAMVSPIKLCILVSKFSEERITNVTPSVKLYKKTAGRKKTVITKT